MQDRIEPLFNDYVNYHRHPANVACHWIGIPMIMASLLGLLSHLGSGHLNGATLLWAGSILWYLTLEWKLAIPFSLVSLGFYFLGTAMPLSLQLAFFVIGWIAQLLGHAVFEKKKPAFLTNIQHLLIGPLWLFAKLIQY
jgi:uncharacterized membrane protein YGL010W